MQSKNLDLSQSEDKLPPFQRLLSIGIIIFAIFCAMCVGLASVDAVGTYPAVDSSVVGYYKLNNQSALGENYFSSNKISDNSSYSINGTIQNSTLAVFNATGGILNDGDIYFNGTISQTIIQIPYDQKTNFSNKDFAVTMWVNPKGTGLQDFVARYLASNTGRSWELRQSASGFLQGIIYHNGSSTNLTTVTGGALIPNSYNFIAISYNYTLNDVSIYLNGNRYNQSATLGRGAYDTSRNITIGATGDLLSNFNGSLDEVRIYNRSLGDQDLFNLYQTYLDCITLTGEGYSFIYSTKICNSSIYYMNGTASQGALNVNAHNIQIDCNGASFVGNGTNYGVYSQSKENITIKNCNLTGYNIGIYSNGLSAVNNFTALNNLIYKSQSSGIYLKGTSNSLINFNILYNNTIAPTTSQASIFIATASRNNKIYNNNASYSYQGISFSEGSNNGEVINNSIFQSENYGIATFDSNYTIIYNNIVNYSRWNGMSISSFYNNISFNILTQAHHAGFQFFGFASYPSGFNNFYNNTIDLVEAGHGIYIFNSSSNRIYDNLIKNIFNITNTAGAYGIEIDGSQGYGNQYVFRNNVTNVSSSCLYSANSFNDTLVNNSLGNCLVSEYAIMNSTMGIYEVYLQTFLIKDVTNLTYNLANNLTSGNSLSLVYGRSNALFHNGTSLCTGSSSNIADNDGNINITLTPSNYCCVIDNYNPTLNTAGLTGTCADPIWDGSINRATNSLTSAVTIPISGLSHHAIVFSDGTVLTNQEGTSYITLDPGEWAQVQVICSSMTGASFQIIMICSALAIIIFVLVFGYRRWQEGINGRDWIIVFVGIIVGVILWQLAGQNLGGTCPVS